MRDQDGRPLDVVPLPMPQPMFYDDQRLPACYCNFYIANGIVIAPQYDDPADAAVLDLLRSLFIGREVIGLPARSSSGVWGPSIASRSRNLRGEWSVGECGLEGHFGCDSLGKTRCFCEVQ